ncbi:MAG TPA: DUF5723 family protein [Bacteroidales bacterium]
MYRKLVGLTFLLLAGEVILKAQQNSTLFFMRSTPQANFVNPAVRNECKWMLGLPVISSLHLQVGNSAFSVMQVLKKQPDNTYAFDGSEVMSNLGQTNYLNAELHVNLFFLSLWRNDIFYTFSVNEKADLFLTYPHDLVAIAWQGNTQFEGQHSDLSRLGMFFNYRREYAFGMAKQPSNNFIWGMRAKLLFGKLNTSVPRSKIDLFTAPATFDLYFNDNIRLNSSLPINVQRNPNNTISNVSFNGNVGNILMNRNNIGLAFDLGFINYRSDRVTVSGSILDLGLIRWTTNGYSFNQDGQYVYHGPIGDTIQESTYLKYLTRVLKDEFGITATSRSYFSFLIPTYYLGTTYKLRDDLDAGALVSGKISRFRVTSGLTFSVNKDFNRKAAVSLSWSYLYRSLNNFGAGIKLGQSPIQFYAVTDNVFGLIKPLDTKNINIRFGLQLNFGCSKTEKKISGCGCSWLQSEEEKRERERKRKK